jgi:carboxyl-terminal processing protease
LTLDPQSAAQASGPVFVDGLATLESSQTLAKTLDEVRSKIRTMAVEAPGEKVLLEGALRGMLEAMNDPYSSYLPASDASETLLPTQTSMVGIGIQVRKSDAGLDIVTPLPGSPARRAGLRPGDTILAIDGAPTKAMSITESVNRIRGLSGSSLRLLVRTPTKSAELEIERGAVGIPSIQGAKRNSDDSWSYLLDPHEKIGYVQICSFTAGTEKEFQDVLAQLDRQAMAGLILDLRFCPGGLFNSTIGVARLLLDKGSIVSMRSSRDMQDSTVAADGCARLGRQPLIVLVNERTSSGGEVLAGALKENGRAVVLGSRTHGKGSLQTILNLGGAKGAIKLTTAQMFLPSGRMIQRLPGASEWGVDPSDGFYVPLNARQILALEDSYRQRRILGQAESGLTETPNDPQLQAALRGMVARLHTGEFARVGRPIAEYAVDLQKNQLEQARLKQQLAEIERELELLGGKEPRSSS